MLDADALPVFLDGYSPGRIVRIAPGGILEAVAVIGLSPSNIAPLVDGALEHATAYSLSGLAFISGGSVILVADTALVSVVRKINLTTGIISSVVGGTRDSESASPGNLAGTSWSDSSFGAITAFALLGDNVMVSDAGNNLLRIIIAANTSYVSIMRGVGEVHLYLKESLQRSHPPPTAQPRFSCQVNCPRGFSCPCGTPIPCTDPHFACPPNQRQPLSVSTGYFAVPAVCSDGVNSVTCFVDQDACPAGSYCEGGVQQLCRAGSYGTDAMQTVVTDCLECKAGSYSALPGANATSNCLPCPTGTFSDAPGSAYCSFCPAGTFGAAEGCNSSMCVPCGPALVSLPGATACVDQGSSSFFATGALVTAQFADLSVLSSDSYIVLAHLHPCALPCRLAFRLPCA